MINHNKGNPAKPEQSGSVMIIAMTALVVLIVITATFMMMSGTQTAQVSKSKDFERCFGIMQAAISDSLQELNNRASDDEIREDDINDASKDGKIVQGTENFVKFGNGEYRVLSRPAKDAGGLVIPGAFDLLVQSKLGNVERFSIMRVTALQKEVAIPGGPFLHALFNGGGGLTWGGLAGRKEAVFGWPPHETDSKGNIQFFNSAGLPIPNDPVTGQPTQPGGVPKLIKDPSKNYPDLQQMLESGQDHLTPLTDKVVPTGADIYAHGNILVKEDGVVAPNSTIRSAGDVTINSTNVDNPEDADNKDNLEIKENQPLDQPEVPNYGALSNVINIRPGDFNARVNFEGPADLFGKTTDITNGSAGTYKLKTSPQHIFRKNSQAISVNGKKIIETTTRDDFFLEDMFSVSPNQNGGVGFAKGPGQDRDNEPFYDATGGAIIKVHPDANNKIYFVEGNLWVNNPTFFTFILGTQPDKSGTQITLAVQGNINISDNFVYENMEKDAIAFVALKNPNDYPDEFGVVKANTLEKSGNIQFGDPTFGTTRRFAGYMYAENDFLADNVANALFIYGNMTAGNNIKITKSGGLGQGLTIHYDARIERQLITLPGLPKNPEDESRKLPVFVPNTFNVRKSTEISSILGKQKVDEFLNQ